MSVSPTDGVSATLVQPAIYRGINEPTTGRIGDLWIDTSGTPVLMLCTSENPSVWTECCVNTGGTFFYLLEDGTSFYLMEDGVGKYLME